MQAQVNKVEARADRFTEMENQLSSLRGELSSVKTVPTVDKISSAFADDECMTCNDDDNYTASRDLGVQAPRNRTSSRSDMPRSAFVVERWHGDVMAGGGDRFETAKIVSSLHTGPIEYSVPLGEHDVHQTHRSTYPTSTQSPSRMGERDPGDARIIHVANRETSTCDEPLYESSLRIDGKSLSASTARGTDVPPTCDFGDNTVPPIESTIPASGEPAGWPAGTLLSSRDSSGGKASYAFADVSLTDEARAHTHPRTHVSEGTQPHMQSKPTYTYEFCRPCVDRRPGMRSADSGKLHVPRTQTSFGDRSFAIAGPRAWNNLPDAIRDSSLSFLTFAKLLKSYLFV